MTSFTFTNLQSNILGGHDKSQLQKILALHWSNQRVLVPKNGQLQLHKLSAKLKHKGNSCPKSTHCGKGRDSRPALTGCACTLWPRLLRGSCLGPRPSCPPRRVPSRAPDSCWSRYDSFPSDLWNKTCGAEVLCVCDTAYLLFTMSVVGACALSG